jgi:translation initiation factor IF-3
LIDAFFAILSAFAKSHFGGVACSRLAAGKGRTIIRKYAFREDPEKPQVRINERIRLSPVRLIDDEGNQVGVVSVDEALGLARSKGLDLVEVSANTRPIVCKIMDYGRFRYEQEKKAREEKRKQHQIDIKEVKFRPNINLHDFETKVRLAQKFLEEGKHVKVTIMFRMRELRRPENGYEVLRRVRDELAEVAKVDREPSRELEGRDLTMVLRPQKK